MFIKASPVKHGERIMDINAKLKADNAVTQRGVAMGRAAWGLEEHRNRPIMMYVQRVKFVNGDYDLGGAYWGGHPSEPLFCAWAENVDARVFVRAKNRSLAKRKVKKHFVNAKFFR